MFNNEIIILQVHYWGTKWHDVLKWSLSGQSSATCMWKAVQHGWLSECESFERSNVSIDSMLILSGCRRTLESYRRVARWSLPLVSLKSIGFSRLLVNWMTFCRSFGWTRYNGRQLLECAQEIVVWNFPWSPWKSLKDTSLRIYFIELDVFVIVYILYLIFYTRIARGF